MSMSKTAPCRVPALFRWLGILLFLLADGAFAGSDPEPFVVGGSVLPIAGTNAPPSALVVELRPAFPSFDAQRAALHGSEPDALLTARVGADGTFLLIVPKPDVYRIDARGLGFRTLTIPFLPLVQPILLAPIHPSTTLPVAIQVLDPDEKPAGGVTVRIVSPAAPPTPTDPNDWRPAAERTRTNSDGRAVVYHEAGVEIRVLAESPGGTALADVPADAPWAIMKMTARPSLSLAVRNAAGRPASGALVYADGIAIAEIDEDGKAEVPAQSSESAPLLVLSESGDWAEVKAPKGGGKAPAAIKIRLSPASKARGKGLAGPRDAPVTLHPATEFKGAVGVAGTVADAAGSPIAGAELFAVRTVETLAHGRRKKERIAERLGTSDLHGGFHAQGLLPGTFDLLARANGYASGRVGSLQIPAGNRLPDLKIALSRGVRIEGRLRDSTGKSAAGVPIEASKVVSIGNPIAEVERPRSTAVSDRDGLFTLTGLESGRYEVTAESPAGKARGFVEAGKEGGRIELTLEVIGQGRPAATPPRR